MVCFRNKNCGSVLLMGCHNGFYRHLSFNFEFKFLVAISKRIRKKMKRKEGPEGDKRIQRNCNKLANQVCAASIVHL